MTQGDIALLGPHRQEKWYDLAKDRNKWRGICPIAAKELQKKRDNEDNIQYR